MSASVQLPDIYRLPRPKAGEEHSYTMGRAANGVLVMLPAVYVDFINDDPYLEAQVDKLAEVVVDVERRTGKTFDRPLQITPSSSHLGFATGLLSNAQMAEMFGKKGARELRNGDKDQRQKGKTHALLQVPMLALMQQSPLSMKDIEGIILHELGHAASRDLISDQSESMLWLESLRKVDRMCLLVKAKPELTAPITAEIGGNEAYLAEADKLFEKVGSEIKDLLIAGGHDAGDAAYFSPESLLDHYYHDKEFMKASARMAKLGTGKTMAGFEQLHDVTVNLLCETVKHKLQFPEGVYSNREHVQVLERLSTFDVISNHAKEFFADDFATRHHPAPTGHLNKLTEHGDSESHPATGKRVIRADHLDNERIGQLVEKDKIDEHTAVVETNRFMLEEGPKLVQARARERFAEQFRERYAQEMAARNARQGEAFRR